MAPCSSGYVHANTALQRCLITASWVPEMQMEGRPWGCRVVHGESLLREIRNHHLPSAGEGNLNTQDHQQDRAGIHAGKAATGCVCRISSHDIWVSAAGEMAHYKTC